MPQDSSSADVAEPKKTPASSRIKIVATKRYAKKSWRKRQQHWRNKRKEMKETRAYCCFVDEKYEESKRLCRFALFCLPQKPKHNQQNNKMKLDKKQKKLLFSLVCLPWKKGKQFSTSANKKKITELADAIFVTASRVRRLSRLRLQPIEAEIHPESVACSAFRFLSSRLSSVSKRLREDRRETERQKRERDGGQGIFCASFGYSPSYMLKTKR
jgi:hypothetical protein